MLELPPKANIATIKSKPDDLNTLQNIWEQAFDRLHSVTTKDKIDQILNITALKDTDYLKEYLQLHENELKPEEKHFIEMSISLKMHPGENKELNLEKNNSAGGLITEDDFQNFVTNNYVSKPNLEMIARKIRNNKPLSPQEMAIYSDKSNDIENLIKSISNKY